MVVALCASAANCKLQPISRLAEALAPGVKHNEPVGL